MKLLTRLNNPKAAVVLAFLACSDVVYKCVQPSLLLLAAVTHSLVYASVLAIIMARSIIFLRCLPHS